MRNMLTITNSHAPKSSSPGDYASHVGNRVPAAQLLYGDDMAGALVRQARAGGNFLEDLAREVAENSQLPDLGYLFVQKSRAAEDTWPVEPGQVQAPGWLTGSDTIPATVGTPVHGPTFEPVPVIAPSTTTQLNMF